jgi:hypothetical protein
MLSGFATGHLQWCLSFDDPKDEVHPEPGDKDRLPVRWCSSAHCKAVTPPKEICIAAQIAKIDGHNAKTIAK